MKRRILTLLIILLSNQLFSQIVAGSAYVRGNLVQFGVNGNGGYEGINTFTSPPPIGTNVRPATGLFGFVANPQNNGWATFDGDFFTPGSPENGWGIQIINGATNIQASNNMSGTLVNIPGSITSYTSVAGCINAQWNGTYISSPYNIGIQINYKLRITDLYYTTTVRITNNGAAIPEFYYYRNVDPDNNQSISGDFTTQNTIVSQPGSGCDRAHVSATSSVPASQPMSYIGFAGVGPDFRVSTGGFSNRIGSEIWNGTGFSFLTAIGSTRFADEAISIANRTMAFATGQSKEFSYVVILDDAAANNAINNLFQFQSPGFTPSALTDCVVPIDTIDICLGATAPLEITGSALSSFTWTWSPGTGLSSTTGPAVMANPTVSTLYTVTGTPTSTCFSPITRQVFVRVVPTPFTVSATGGSLCSGGTVPISASGGTSYTWAPATGLSSTTGATVTASPTTTTTYTVTGTNAAGCVSVATATVTVGTGPVLTTSMTPVLCNGGATGTATVTPASGSGYTYSWAPTGGSSSTATGLIAGTYTATVSLGTCSSTTTVIVTQPTILNATTSQVNILCNGAATGSASVVPSGGAGGYTYSWAPSGGISATATGLVAGTYTCTITDANLCSITRTFTITQPTVLTATTSQTNVLCFGNSTGSASVVASGGVGGYTYIWAPSGGTSATATGLAAGTYTCTIRDANLCQTTRVFTITQPAAPLSNAVTQTNVLCNGSSTGSATVTPSGGTAGYTYTWFPSVSTTSIATGLAASNYTCTVTDLNGCTATNIFTITQPTALNATLTATTATCSQANGSATASSVSGGVGGYTYSWTPTGGSAVTASSITPGSYTLQITDANGCSITRTVVVPNLGGPTAGISTTNNVTCNGLNNGSITAFASGGTGVLTYSWSPVGGTGLVASGLAPNTYTITVTDATGCTSNATSTITEPPPLTTSVTSFVDPLCNGGASGSINTTTVGGTGSYTYAWTPSGTVEDPSGLAAGTYGMTVTDANGCTATLSATLNNPALLTSAIVSTVDVSCNGFSDGSITTTVSGGTGTIDYLWNTGGTVPSPSGIPAGTYSMTATDDNGCITTLSATVNEPSPLSLNITSPDPILCLGELADFTATPSGGAGGFTFVWDNSLPPSASNTVSPTSTTTYNLIVTDANGCTITDDIEVVVNPLPTPSFSTSNNCLGINSLFANTSSISSGTITSNSWTFGDGASSTTSSPTHLYMTSGTYPVTLTSTSNNGCTSSITQNITVYNMPIPAITADNISGCEVHCVTFSDVSNMNGTTLATADWFVNGNPSTTFECLTRGLYDVTLTVTTTDGCVASITNDDYITVYPKPEALFSVNSPIYKMNEPVVVNDNSIGNITNWNWDFGNGTTSTNNGLFEVLYADSGTFCINLIVTSSDGCKDTTENCVTIMPVTSVYIPNTFTPDGDNLNELFGPEGYAIKEFVIYIYNRWGEEIYTSSTINNAFWDGTLKGIPAQQGVYAYRIVVTDYFNQSTEYKGQVNLIR